MNAIDVIYENNGLDAINTMYTLCAINAVNAMNSSDGMVAMHSEVC